MTTVASHLGLYRLENIALIHELVFSEFQTFFTGGTESFLLGVEASYKFLFSGELLHEFWNPSPYDHIYFCPLFTRYCSARYGVQLEQGPFQRRTADFLWMMIFGAISLLALSIVPILRGAFLGISLVFMLLYIWSREFPNAQVNIYGLVALKAFYLPWAMLALDVIFGSPLVPDLMGIIAGHLYYFLTVLHPLAGGRNIISTPRLVHKLVARARLEYPTNARVPQERTTGVAFTGRSYRLNSSTGRGFSLRRFWSS
ncbi:hypothetical protein Gotri_009366 [Gossypium trilobum]|uniref:Derlin n=1 Tax=Gossypium trilobum TaxID=34281 RepID=A0A7J9EM96_9ROSI|nr:hypothetical protein [Gossypium trilobum]